MKPTLYVIILVVMFAFLLISPFKWIILVVMIFFITVKLIRYLFWRNKFDYD